ncbi:uncharacterized protein [Littorina saxatilis]|uniref:uncharacterized protein n=1 Tax=Littorina saxatilis TaxID=31220 RepID=UPI0038B60EA9
MPPKRAASLRVSEVTRAAGGKQSRQRASTAASTSTPIQEAVQPVPDLAMLLAEMRRMGERQEAFQTRAESAILSLQRENAGLRERARQESVAAPTLRHELPQPSRSAVPQETNGRHEAPGQSTAAASLIHDLTDGAVQDPVFLGSRGSSADSPSTSCSHLDETAHSLLYSSISNSTRQAYHRTWKFFMEFHRLHEIMFEFPSAKIVLIRFVAFMHERKYASSSITSAVSAISFVHKVVGADDPADSLFVRKMLQGCKRLSNPADARLPITLHILDKVVGASQKTMGNLYAQTRFKAMCTLAFHALLRVGEMTSSPNTLQQEDVYVEVDSLTITFRKYKHSTGATSQLTVKACSNEHICAVAMMKNYLRVRGARTGSLFLSSAGTPVLRSQFCAELKCALQFCGYPQARYNTHSFRIGGATHLASQGASDAQIRHAGRWASNAFTSYVRLQSTT